MPILLLCLFPALTPVLLATEAAAEAPVLPAGTWECHGTARLRGQTQESRFWMRLRPPERTYGGNRVLEVVYEPPPPAALGGTHLADVPFLLLDEHARLMAWNERTGMSHATPGTDGAATYVATRDRTPDDRTEISTHQRTIVGGRGWDRSLAPLLLAMTWHADARARLPLIDLFGDAPAAEVSWNGTEVDLGGAAMRIEADGGGRLKRLVDGTGTPLVIVRGWLKQGDQP